jgi:hypothetical protein
MTCFCQIHDAQPLEPEGDSRLRTGPDSGVVWAPMMKSVGHAANDEIHLVGGLIPQSIQISRKPAH